MIDVPTEYIWHCPRKKSCGSIVMKTNRPFLDDGKVICRHCGTEITMLEIAVANRQNVEIYLKFLNQLKTRWDIDKGV